MMMIAYGWSPSIPRLWFLVGFVIALYCVLRCFLDWKAAAEEAIRAAEAAEKRPET